jgi:hypothetical protein
MPEIDTFTLKILIPIITLALLDIFYLVRKIEERIHLRLPAKFGVKKSKMFKDHIRFPKLTKVISFIYSKPQKIKKLSVREKIALKFKMK